MIKNLNNNAELNANGSTALVILATKKNNPKKVVPQELQKLKKIIEHPTTIGFLEFITGAVATAGDKPVKNLILTGGHLIQALCTRRFHQQLYTEIQKYRNEGKITDEKLDSNYGKAIFIDLMRTIDEESLDDKKFAALKAIFLHSVLKDSDEHSQILAYQYFQVCKKLSSMDILILRTAFSIYEESEGDKPPELNSSWETRISQKLGIPVEFVIQCKREHNASNQNSKGIIFDSGDIGRTMHGLTELGLAIGKLIQEG